jgi:DNA-binding NarL/FixJ family response regulator
MFNMLLQSIPQEITNFLESLTDRERTILNVVVEGFSSDEIADRLCLSKDTIDTHRRHILEKWRDATGITATGKPAARLMALRVRPHLTNYP